VGELLAVVSDLADRIARARASIAPPAGLDVDLEAWRALAARLEAELVVGDLSIAGRYDGLPAAVNAVFDGDGRAMTIRVRAGDERRASERAREVSLALARPTEQATSVSHERARALLATWPADVIDLE